MVIGNHCTGSLQLDPVCSTVGLVMWGSAVGLVTWGSAVGLVMWDRPDGNISPRLSLYCSQFLLSLIQTEWLS